jgi:thiamine-phosphate pyrophosphorylase
MTDRPPLDLRLYLVTDPVLVGDLGVAGTVAAAAAAGITVVQLRDPDADDAGFVATGRALAAVLAGTGIPLIVNDRVHLVEAIGADGAHVGQGDLDPVTARRMLGPQAWLGLSVQTVEHVEVALQQPEADLDYLGVGPVWAQQTKPDAAEPGGTALLAEIVGLSPWPCVAIGGIDGDRVAQVRRTGAAGVAVVSAICGRPDVAAATRALLASWESAGEPAGEPIGKPTTAEALP